MEGETAEILLSKWRADRADIVEQRDELDGKITALDKLISHLEQCAAKSGELALTPTGRVPRGQSEALITQFLKQRNGAGALISEIIEGTGTKYGTVHRVLKLLKNQGQASQTVDSRWHWGQ